MNCPNCRTEFKDIPILLAESTCSLEFMPCTYCGSDIFVNIKKNKITLSVKPSYEVRFSEKEQNKEIKGYSDRVANLFVENKSLKIKLVGLEKEREIIHKLYEQIKFHMTTPKCFICGAAYNSNPHNETCPIREINSLYSHDGDIFELV